MSAVEPGTATSGIVERVKSILLRPAATWEVIDAEPATVGGIFKGYVVPLALIPVVAGLIGGVVFGYGLFGVNYKPPILGAVVSAAVTYGLSLLGVYLLALIIDGLAPTFGGQKSQVQAFKVAAYASTASWVAGIFQIYPPLMWLSLLGLYSLYLLYRGLPPLMKTPEEKALPYTAVVIVVAIVIAIVVGIIAQPIRNLGAGAGYAGAAAGAGTISVGGKSVDMAELEAQSKRIEEAARQLESGEGPEAVQPDVLKAYLPDSVAGYARTEVTTGSGGAAGVTGSQAEGVYTKGEARIRLSVTDLGAAGALAGLANAFNVESSSERDGKYEKVGKVDGRMTQESYDSAAGHGQYSVLIGERFMVSAEGEGASMADLKAAVAAIPSARLEGLAKG
jgi:hypothetical protein